MRAVDLNLAMTETEKPQHGFVSRAGLKIEHALNEFDFAVTGLICADFGCNVGGFTDCLLQRGAKQVYALDTGYGTLAWKLRSDLRVIVMERTNALHAEPPVASGTGVSPVVDLITIDLAWTRQKHAIPAALRWLNSGGNSGGHLISLIKPHYELEETEKRELLRDGCLPHAEARRVMERELSRFPQYGAEVLQWTQSPITGSKSSRKKRKKGGLPPGTVGPGNIEFLVLAQPLKS